MPRKHTRTTERLTTPEAREFAVAFLCAEPVPPLLRPFRDYAGFSSPSRCFRLGECALVELLSNDWRRHEAPSHRKLADHSPAGFFLLMAEAILEAAGESPSAARQRAMDFASEHPSELGFTPGTPEVTLRRLRTKRSQALGYLADEHARERGNLPIPATNHRYEIFASYAEHFPALSRVITGRPRNLP
jgi:hypothetical protein